MLSSKRFMSGAGIRVSVIGHEKTIKKLANFGTLTQNKVLLAVKKSLIMIQSEAHRLISNNIYWKNPIDTGRMRASLTNQIVSYSYLRIEGKVGTNVNYAFYVHEGTMNMYRGSLKVDHKKGSGPDIAAKYFSGDYWGERPFLTDALENKKEKIIAMVLAAYKKELYL